jgi:hypothetical protein
MCDSTLIDLLPVGTPYGIATNIGLPSWHWWMSYVAQQLPDDRHRHRNLVPYHPNRNLSHTLMTKKRQWRVS